jgi:hypothetical protein
MVNHRKLETEMGNRLQLPSLVPSNNNPHSATNTFGAWLSSKLDGVASIISPLRPRTHFGSVEMEAVDV